jgi:hypothetical protein
VEAVQPNLLMVVMVALVAGHMDIQMALMSGALELLDKDSLGVLGKVTMLHTHKVVVVVVQEVLEAMQPLQRVAQAVRVKFQP